MHMRAMIIPKKKLKSMLRNYAMIIHRMVMMIGFFQVRMNTQLMDMMIGTCLQKKR